MPSSNLAVAPSVLNMIWEKRIAERPLRILDVGPGWGKYALLIREYVDKDAQITAVEAWEPYIRDHRLWSLYDSVIDGDICDQSEEFLRQFDGVLMIDVIEHIPKEKALALIDKLPGWVIICTPRDFFENPAHLPPTEVHCSHWTLEEFSRRPRFDTHAPHILQDMAGILVRLKPENV